MVRADGQQTKIHYKGKNDDYIIFVESQEIVQKWKSDKTVPLVDVVNSFKILKTHKHGAQGELDTASKADLENEFGSSKDEDVVIQILEKGNLQQTKNAERVGTTNESKGAYVAQ